MGGIAKRGGRERKQRPEGERIAATVELGEILQILRISRGMSQAEVAEKSGVTNSALSEYERGKKSPELKNVRFRTLGCYPLTGAIESNASTLPEIIQEMLLTTSSERQGRVIDHDSSGSMEKKKQEGYF